MDYSLAIKLTDHPDNITVYKLTDNYIVPHSGYKHSKGIIFIFMPRKDKRHFKTGYQRIIPTSCTAFTQYC